MSKQYTQSQCDEGARDLIDILCTVYGDYKILFKILMHQKPQKSIAKDFNHYFGPKYVYMVDGQAAMTNPNDEFGKLVNFFGFESDIIHFELNEEKLISDWPTNPLSGFNNNILLSEHFAELSKVKRI